MSDDRYIPENQRPLGFSVSFEDNRATALAREIAAPQVQWRINEINGFQRDLLNPMSPTHAANAQMRLTRALDLTGFTTAQASHIRSQIQQGRSAFDNPDLAARFNNSLAPQPGSTYYQGNRTSSFVQTPGIGDAITRPYAARALTNYLPYNTPSTQPRPLSNNVQTITTPWDADTLARRQAMVQARPSYGPTLPLPVARAFAPLGTPASEVWASEPQSSRSPYANFLGINNGASLHQRLLSAARNQNLIPSDDFGMPFGVFDGLSRGLGVPQYHSARFQQDVEAQRALAGGTSYYSPQSASQQYGSNAHRLERYDSPAWQTWLNSPASDDEQRAAAAARVQSAIDNFQFPAAKYYLDMSARYARTPVAPLDNGIDYRGMSTPESVEAARRQQAIDEQYAGNRAMLARQRADWFGGRFGHFRNAPYGHERELYGQGLPEWPDAIPASSPAATPGLASRLWGGFRSFARGDGLSRGLYRPLSPGEYNVGQPELLTGSVLRRIALRQQRDAMFPPLSSPAPSPLSSLPSLGSTTWRQELGALGAGAGGFLGRIGSGIGGMFSGAWGGLNRIGRGLAMGVMSGRSRGGFHPDPTGFEGGWYGDWSPPVDPGLKASLTAYRRNVGAGGGKFDPYDQGRMAKLWHQLHVERRLIGGRDGSDYFPNHVARFQRETFGTNDKAQIAEIAQHMRDNPDLAQAFVSGGRPDIDPAIPGTINAASAGNRSLIDAPYGTAHAMLAGQIVNEHANGFPADSVTVLSQLKPGVNEAMASFQALNQATGGNIPSPAFMTPGQLAAQIISANPNKAWQGYRGRGASIPSLNKTLRLDNRVQRDRNVEITSYPAGTIEGSVARALAGAGFKVEGLNAQVTGSGDVITLQSQHELAQRFVAAQAGNPGDWYRSLAAGGKLAQGQYDRSDQLPDDLMAYLVNNFNEKNGLATDADQMHAAANAIRANPGSYKKLLGGRSYFASDAQNLQGPSVDLIAAAVREGSGGFTGYGDFTQTPALAGLTGLSADAVRNMLASEVGVNTFHAVPRGTSDAVADEATKPHRVPPHSTGHPPKRSGTVGSQPGDSADWLNDTGGAAAGGRGGPSMTIDGKDVHLSTAAAVLVSAQGPVIFTGKAMDDLLSSMKAGGSRGGGPGSPPSPPGSPGSSGSSGNPNSVRGALNSDESLIGRSIIRLGWELSFLQNMASTGVNKVLTASDAYRQAAAQADVLSGTSINDASLQPFGTGGANDVSGLRSTFSMYSSAQLKQAQVALASTLGLTGSSATISGQGSALTNILAAAAMGGVPVEQLAQFAGSTGGMLGGTNTIGNTNTALAQMLGLGGGLVNQQNIAPITQALQTLNPVATMLGQSPADVYSLLYTAHYNAGVPTANLPLAANAFSSLYGAGYSPNLQQQLQLNNLYGSTAYNPFAGAGWQEMAGNGSYPTLSGSAGRLIQSLTNNLSTSGVQSPQAAQFDLSQMDLFSKIFTAKNNITFNVPQLQIDAGNAQINLSAAQLGASATQLAYQAANLDPNAVGGSYWASIQELGPIGADRSRTAFFDFERNAAIAGYDQTNPEVGGNYQPTTPFGLQNEQFYAGIENQRQNLVLGRSKLTSDAQFQQQLKYLNEQESFYERQLEISNATRQFQEDWGLKLLAADEGVLGAQSASLEIQRKLWAAQEPIIEQQAKLLPLQLAAMQAQQRGEIAVAYGYGAGKNGQPFTATDLLGQMANKAKGMNAIDLNAMVNSYTGNDANSTNIIEAMIAQVQKTPGLLKTNAANFNANGILNTAYNNFLDTQGAGAFTGAGQVAGQTDAYLAASTDIGALDLSVQGANTLFKQLGSDLSPIMPLLSLLSSGLSVVTPLIFALAAVLNLIAVGGAIKAGAGGGLGGLFGGAAGGAGAAGGTAVAAGAGGTAAVTGADAAGMDIGLGPSFGAALGGTGGIGAASTAGIAIGVALLAGIAAAVGAGNGDKLKKIIGDIFKDPSKLLPDLGQIFGLIIPKELAKGLESIPKVFGNAFKNIDWGKDFNDGTLFTKLGGDFFQALGKVDWGSIAKGAGQLGLNIIKGLGQLLVGSLSIDASLFGDILNALFTGLASALTGAIQVGTFLNKVQAKIGDGKFWNGVGQAIWGFVTNWDNAGPGWGTVMGKIGEMFGNLFGSIGNTIGDLIMGPIVKLINGAIDMINNDIIAPLNKVPGIDISKIQHVGMPPPPAPPSGVTQGTGRHADGGFIGQSQWSWVGERGPEMQFLNRNSTIVSTEEILSALRSNTSNGNVGTGTKNVTITLNVRGGSTTLTSESKDDLMAQLIKLLNEEVQATFS